MAPVNPWNAKQRTYTARLSAAQPKAVAVGPHQCYQCQCTVVGRSGYAHCRRSDCLCACADWCSVAKCRKAPDEASALFSDLKYCETHLDIIVATGDRIELMISFLEKRKLVTRTNLAVPDLLMESSKKAEASKAARLRRKQEKLKRDLIESIKKLEGM